MQPSTRKSFSTTNTVYEQEDDTIRLTKDDPNFRRSKGAAFWVIIFTLGVMTLLSAAENSVVTTALPTILQKLDVRNEYIWVNSAFFLTG